MTPQPPPSDPSDIEKRLRAAPLVTGSTLHLEAADEIARLRADLKILAFGDPAHTYECPFWRIGKKHGPCICGAAEIQAQVDAARARLKGSS